MKRNRPLNQEKREAIIKAAISEFYNKGYENTSMDTVAKEANVSKATVYNHFSSKDELFFSIVFSLKEKFEEVFSYEFDRSKTIEDQLREMALKEMELLSDEEIITLIKIATVAMIQKNEVGLQLAEHAKEDMICVVAKWFEKAIELGHFHKEDPTFMAKHFIGTIKSFAFHPQLYGAPLLSKEEQAQVIDKSVETMLKLYAK